MHLQACIDHTITGMQGSSRVCLGTDADMYPSKSVTNRSMYTCITPVHVIDHVDCLDLD